MEVHSQVGLFTVRRLYDGGALVAEYDQTGALLRRFVHGPNTGADTPLVWYEGPTMSQAAARMLNTDLQGSVTSVTDFNGAPLGINRYDEYGRPQAGNTGRFQYTGQAWLPEIGLYYYKARMYSPTLGRFMQTDPIGYADGVNWYNYVGGDRVNAVDPSGKSYEFATNFEILSWPQQFLQDDFSSSQAWRSDAYSPWANFDRSSFDKDAPPRSPCLGFGSPCDPRNENDGPDQKSYLRWLVDRAQESLRGTLVGDFLNAEKCDGPVDGNRLANVVASGARRGTVSGAVGGAIVGSWGGPPGSAAGAAGGAISGAASGGTSGGAVSIIRQRCRI